MMNRKPFYSRDNNNQLELICDLVGSPASCKSYQSLPRHSRNIIKQLQEHQREPKDLSKKFQFLSKNGVDLLKRLLTFNSKDRITAADALKHPFFKHLHVDKYEPVREEKVSPL
jgi:serine/threonine protein kinase